MEKSLTIAELAKALLGFQAEVKTIGYDAKNPFFKSSYATLTQLVTMSKEALVHHGLAVSQLTEGEGGITTILMHTSGEYICSTLTLKAVKDDPQGHGSAITYARRYGYASILGLVSDEDDDGNASTMPEKTFSKSQGQTIEQKANTSTIKDPKDIQFNPSDNLKITTEQGKALVKYLETKGYVLQDLKEMVFFDFNYEKVTDIKNGDLIKIKEHFSKPKEVEVKK